MCLTFELCLNPAALSQLCVGKLTEEVSPALDTMKMQVYFDMNYTSRREWIQTFINHYLLSLVTL